MAFISQIKLSDTTYDISAIKLKNARTIQTNLASTSTASFDGTANITPGVTGVLPIANGGTGASDALSGYYNLAWRGTPTSLNDASSIGFYKISPSVTNTPYEGMWGACMLLTDDAKTTGNTSGSVWQMAFTTASTDLHLRCRTNGTTWQGWHKLLTSNNYTDYTVTKTGGGASGTWPISISGNAATATTSSNSNWLNVNSTLQYGASGLNYFNISGTAGSAANANQTPTADWYHIIRMNHANSGGYYTDIASCFHDNNMYMKRVANGSSSGWLHIWVQGNSVTGAVWNDYAECRESDCEEFGYVLMEVGDDSLTKTTERLSHFAGVSSDTWGFSQGETDKAKTPIAVAGRVLVYPYQDRNNYKPGDCVCAAPGGTVDIMTREEVINWPDRIVGTVSCVPDYEEWGGGQGADRDPVKINGRIWIKIK